MKSEIRKGGVFEGRAPKPGRPAAVLLSVLLGLALSASPLAAQDPLPRRISVVLAVDRAIDNRSEWRIAAARFLDDCFRTFGRLAPLDLRLADVATWSPEPGRRPLRERLGELRRKVRRGSCDIVLGVVASEHVPATPLGMAKYGRAEIIIKNMASREAMTYAVLHELGHVFGAADIREKGSIMGLEEPELSFDAFTAQVIRLNAGRSFDRTSATLAGPALDGVISLFEDRAGRGLKEPQIPLFLTLHYLQKDDLEAAARACAAAAEADPDFPGLHNLEGTVRMFRGEYDLAIEEYRKAIQAEPYEPGILFNYGLACVETGLLDEAAAAFGEALRADANYVEARRALELVTCAGGEVEAAKSAVRPYLLTLRKSG